MESSSNVNDTVTEIVEELERKNLLHMSSSRIKTIKNNILQKLCLTREELLKYHKTLEYYKYIDELDEINIGSYVRWFNLKKMDNIKLTNGGIIIDIQSGNDDITIVCKNNINRIFSLSLNKCIIFQKLNYQEQLLVKIVDYIQK
jgi:hypothetical protein|tara:strand:- start:1979 stop:2413 length:435 start_codon:yes stop_codon:yes gene_type:complete